MKTYTGVGSRETPQLYLDAFESIAGELCKAGFTLRSGGAEGADVAFESGACGDTEIFLPWRKFNQHQSDLWDPPEEAFTLAKAVVGKRWDRTKKGAKKLHARNCQQVLGENLDDPSEFLICWTHGGRPVGGTRTAIIVAHDNNVPVVGLGGPEFKFSYPADVWDHVKMELGHLL